MKIVIVGGGPAGLYAAILLKRSRPEIMIELVEQNAPDSTFGFGVVFSERALGFLRGDDPDTADLLEPRMEQWSDITVVHRGQKIVIDGIGFSAIGRLELLNLLRHRASELGVVPSYQTKVHDLSRFPDADLIIGADGINSVVRASAPRMFGEDLGVLGNHFVWFGAKQSYPTLTQTFKSTPQGAFNAHHYRYAPDMSTFLVECDESTFANAGFVDMDERQSRTVCETIFADELDGARLVANHSVWRQFPVLRCANWHVDNRVLVGDALHTAHFSIGSGTRLAMEDVIALVHALNEADFDMARALPLYQSQRQSVLDKILDAADRSAAWYESFAHHMALDPWHFALSYICRAGRLDAKRLRRLAPKFTQELDLHGVEMSE